MKLSTWAVVLAIALLVTATLPANAAPIKVDFVFIIDATASMGGEIAGVRNGFTDFVANLGSKGMAGEELVTMAWGVRVPFRNGISTGFSYERVLSQRQDIFEQRATWMVEYTF